MRLTIEISPALVKRLEEEAAERGLAANHYAGKVLEQLLLGATTSRVAFNNDSNAWAVLESMMGTIDGPSDWSTGQKSRIKDQRSKDR